MRPMSDRADRAPTVLTVHGYSNGGEEVTCRLDLETICSECKGSGWQGTYVRVPVAKLAEEAEACAGCHGSGYAPSSQGALVLEFLDKWRP